MTDRRLKYCSEECPRYSEKLSSPCIPGKGPLDAKIMIIGENPGRVEDARGFPFVGRSGKLLDKVLAECGVDRSEVYVTNAVKCFTNKEDPKPTAREIKFCRKFIEKEIKKVKPNVLGILGASSLKSIINRTGIGKLKNNILFSDEFNIKVVPTYHPAYVLRNPHEYKYFYAGIKLIVEESKKQAIVYKSPIKTTYLFADTEKKIDKVLSKLEEVNAFVFDMETTHLHYLSTKPLLMAVSWKEGLSVTLPASVLSNELFFNRIKNLFLSKEKLKIAQNIIFDMHILRVAGIEVKPPFFDTMTAHHLIDENSAHGLEDLTLRYLDLGEYWSDLEDHKKRICKDKKIKKDDFTYDMLPMEILIPYANKDADGEFRLYKIFTEELKRQGLFDFYKKYVLPCIPIILDMEHRGILIDRNKLKNLVDEYIGKVIDSEKEMYKLNDVIAFEKVAYEKEYKVLADKFNESANKLIKKYEKSKNLQSRYPDGVQQYIEARYPGGEKEYVTSNLRKESEIYLRDKFNKTPMFRYKFKDEQEYIKDTLGDKPWCMNFNSTQQLSDLLFNHMKIQPIKKTKTGYSTDSEVLEELEKDGVEIAKTINEFRKLVKYTSTYIVSIYEKSEYDGRLHGHFGQTFTVSGRWNSSKPNLQNIPRDAKDLKKCFLADPGYMWVKADLAQAEFRCWAHYSGDEDMLADIHAGLDIHRKTASEVFGIPEEEISKDDVRRTAAKNAVFGLMYGRGPKAIAEQYKITLEEAVALRESFFARYPIAKDWLDSLITHAREFGYVQTWLGRVRRLPKINSDNDGERAEAERQSMNSPIQGLAADMNNYYMIQSVKRAKKEKVDCFPCMNIHDANILQVKKDQVKDLMYIMNDVVKTSFPDFKCEMKLDFEVGDTLGTLEETK